MTPAGRAIDVLLIEDDPGDEVITREAFEHNKIKNNLHVAHDGEEGLDFLYQRGAFKDAPRPDLVLLDLNLPKYDGRQLLEQIKSDPELSHIPVVVLTTSSAEEDILRSYKLHANAYVTKPVDLDQFMEAVRQIDEFFVQVVRLPPILRGRVERHAHRGAVGRGIDVHACADRTHDRQSPAAGARSESAVAARRRDRRYRQGSVRASCFASTQMAPGSRPR